MKLTSIEIYGFGQFENKKINLAESDGIHVFYGQNEAGKTTIIAFIHAILFGFPTRNQSENRYEPKTGAKYGGKLSVQVNENENYIIERILGRAIGEVKIYDENGLAGGEDMLHKLLNGLDRSLYQAIFSFNFKGLQGVEHVNAAELSRYLFSAGASGSQSLFDCEKKISKRLDDLYKPNGRKPILNEKINELENLRKQLINWEDKIEVYNNNVDEQQSLSTEIEEIEEKINEINTLLKQYEKKMLIKPHVEERRKWQIQLDQIGDYSYFPVDGLNRLQQLQFQLRPLRGQYESISQKITELKGELAGIHLQHDLLNLEETVRALKDKQQVIEMQEKQVDQINTTLKHELSEMETLFEKLGPGYTDISVLEVETSLVVKQKLKELTAKEGRLKEQQKLLDEQFEKAKRDVEITELTIERLKNTKGNPKNSLVLIALIIAIIGGGVTTWFLSQSIYPLIVSFILLVGLPLYFFTNKPKGGLQLEKETTILQQHEELFNDILRKFEDWEIQLHKVEKELELFCANNKLPSGLSGEQLVIAFDLIEELKKRTRTKNQLMIETDQLKSSIESYYQKIAGLVPVFHLNERASIMALSEMIKRVDQEKDKKQYLNRLLEKQTDYHDERSKLKKQIEQFELAINDLFTSAQVEDEDGFRRKGLAFDEFEMITSKLRSIESYLGSILKKGEDDFVREVENENVDCERLIVEFEEEAHKLREQVKRHQLRVADLTAEIKALEDGTAYSDLIHRYEAEKAAFQEEAKDWAILQVARDFIDKTKDYYREVRLPHVIQTAQQFFSFLTFDRYPFIFPPTDVREFLVQRNDGITFAPSELSQATTEQLYLSIRLALAINYKSPSPLPIIIDDSFVNFDKERTKRALALIHNIGKEHQILFFTCHSHVVQYYEGENVINL